MSGHYPWDKYPAKFTQSKALNDYFDNVELSRTAMLHVELDGVPASGGKAQRVRITSIPNEAHARWKAFIARIEYKPGYTLKAKVTREGVPWLMVEAWLPDCNAPKDPLVRVAFIREFPELRELWNERDALYLVTRMLDDYDRHERREWLRLDGKRTDDPHPEEKRP